MGKNRAGTAYSQYNACWPKTLLMAQVPPREIQMAAISPVSIPTSKGYQGWGQLIKTLMVTRLLMPADKLVVSRRWN